MGRQYIYAKTNDTTEHALSGICNCLAAITADNLTYTRITETCISDRELSTVVRPVLLYVYDAMLFTVVASCPFCCWQSVFTPFVRRQRKQSSLCVIINTSEARSSNLTKRGLICCTIVSCFYLVLITDEWKNCIQLLSGNSVKKVRFVNTIVIFLTYIKIQL